MAAIAKLAPFVLKPLAGLYNPFSSGCSFLCNHPTDIESREIIRNAKETLNTEGKHIISISEALVVTTAKPNLDVELNIDGEQLTPTNIYIPQVESVPEELFRRYTDTDSRPQTPAPTLVSGITRLSTSRRCVTPDPLPISQIKEKKRLILDLRRTHSQEILSIYGSSPFYQDPPEIRIHQALSSSGSQEDVKFDEAKSTTPGAGKQSTRRPGSVKKGENAHNTNAQNEGDKTQDEEDDDDDEEYVKRRGKRRRKKTRDASRGPTTFHASVDPETQVATIGPDSHNPSARHSLAPEGTSPHGVPVEEVEVKKPRIIKSSTSLEIDSYLTKEILKQLRRELDEITVDSELNSRRRKALEEALRTVNKGKPACDELATLQKELKVPPVNVDLWLGLPRTFTRSSAIFQLPMDSRIFNTMTPLDYVKDNIKITSARKLLYNCIFHKYKIELEDEDGYERQLHSNSLKACLDLVMGNSLSENQFLEFQQLIQWNKDDVFGFKTCCGIFALCERILAPQFCPELPSKKEDSCHEIETADFNLLEEKLEGRNVSENLKTIFYRIKNL